MLYSAYKYIDVALGGPQNRNNVQDVTTFRPPVGEKDCYRTIFRFDENYLKHFKLKKSVSGYKGRCYADFITIDIDNIDLNVAWDNTRNLIAVLEIDYGYDVEHLFFSGAKGFHIYLPSQAFGKITPSEYLPLIFKNIITNICENDFGIDYQIYEINRLLRLTNSIHSKSNLYKIPLTRLEFEKGTEHILGLAKTSRQSQHSPMSDTLENDQLAELYHKHKNDLKSAKSYRSKELCDKLEKGVSEGERDLTATRLAGLLKSCNIEKPFCKSILIGWNHGNDPPLSDEQIKKVVDSIYRYGDDQDVEILEGDICPIWAAGDDYIEHVKSSKKVNIGITFIDEKIRGIRPGQVCTLLGFTGNFKSGLLQWILRHYFKYSLEPVLLFELEMTRLDLFERAAQMTTKMSGQEIEDIFKGDDGEKKYNLMKQVQEDQGLFYIVDRPGLTFYDMEKYIQIVQRMANCKLRLIGIDFLQLMAAEGITTTQRMDNIAKGLKTFAKRVDLPVIALSQVTDKEDEYSKINLMDARDSKTIAQMSDYAIGISLKKGTDDIIIISILKNRKGGKKSGQIKIDRKSMRFEEI